ncbi:hypothetical protein MNBD_GAMMA05-823 [hydrothermal vent metagenome]|uniref:Uncharacterized protein n=1 Tax=hydrothermal vent metagenome TaxID=652676 RepID=A0A3B0WFT3_9ZZZZ
MMVGFSFFIMSQTRSIDKRVIALNGWPVSYQAAFELLSKLSSEAIQF